MHALKRSSFLSRPPDQPEPAAVDTALPSRRQRRGHQRHVHLPDDIVLEILLRATAATVLRCRAVCRRWRDMASRSDFAAKHLQRAGCPAGEAGVAAFFIRLAQTIPYDTVIQAEFAGGVVDAYATVGRRFGRVHVTNSSAGWICLFSELGGEVFNLELLNPTTGERHAAPRPSCIGGDAAFIEGFLDSDPAAGRYTLVFAVAVHLKHTSATRLDVLAVDSSAPRLQWRTAADRVPADVRPMGGVLAGGAIHWLSKPSSATAAVQLISYIISDEAFATAAGPCGVPASNGVRKTLLVLDGRLGLAASTFGSSETDIWVQEDAARSAWAPRYRVAHGVDRPVVVHDGKLFFRGNDNCSLRFLELRAAAAPEDEGIVDVEPRTVELKGDVHMMVGIRLVEESLVSFKLRCHEYRCKYCKQASTRKRKYRG